MKAVILAGGFGTRISEETIVKPKPLVEIGGRPILWHIMKIFSQYDVNDFVLCLGYKGEMIKDYFVRYSMSSSDFTIRIGSSENVVVHNDSPEAGWRVTFVDTGLDAMTGARIKRIQPFVDGEPFFLTYGDGVANVPLDLVLNNHLKRRPIGTVTGVHPPSRFGELVIDGDRVVEFSEKPQVRQGYINGGFFVFDTRIFDYVRDEDSCVFEREPLERLASDGQLEVFRHEGYWQCMDTYRDWQMLNDAWQRNAAPWKVWSK